MTVHFVLPAGHADMLDTLPNLRLDESFPYWKDGCFNWVAMSWLVLREYREGLTISTSPRPGQINFSHGQIWRELGPRVGEFRLSTRADYPRLFDIDFEILQNSSVPIGKNTIFLPYWPVPGIIPRDPTRKGVQTVAYAGFMGAANLDKSLVGKIKRFDFKVIPPQQWHDLSKIDILIAIRSFGHAPHNNKPASKLYSAWRANIPLVAGWDSAFSDVGQPGKDYLRIDTAETFVVALERLADDPALYESIVAAGRVRAPEVSHEAMAQDWLAALDGPVQTAFEAWQYKDGIGRRSVARSADRMRAILSAGKSALRRRSRA